MKTDFFKVIGTPVTVINGDNNDSRSIILFVSVKSELKLFSKLSKLILYEFLLKKRRMVGY